MNVFQALCVEDHTPAPDEDATFTLVRGKEYTVSRVRTSDDTVMVFSRYWVRVPSRLFAGVVPLRGHAEPWREPKGDPTHE